MNLQGHPVGSAGSISRAIKRGIQSVSCHGGRDESFRDYASRVFPALPRYDHVELIAETLQAVVEREILRLMIFAPPRYYKSMLVSRLLGPYQLYRDPTQMVGLACSTAPLARIMSKDARSFYAYGGGRMRTDSKDASLWLTEESGGMWARGIDGLMLGVGYDIGIVDDPFRSYADAASSTVQHSVYDWFWNTFYNRRELEGDKAAIVVMHQRLTEGDLAGRLLEKEKEAKSAENWVVLNLPAIKRSKLIAFPSTCTLIGDHREEGEALCPELQTVEELEDLERKDTDSFESIYQQWPRSSQGGGVFDQSWFQPIGDPDLIESVIAGNPSATWSEILSILQEIGEDGGGLPTLHRIARGWDFAASQDAGDSTVGMLGGVTEDERVIWLDVIEEKVGPARVKSLIVETGLRDGSGIEYVIPREPAAAGKILVHDIQEGLERIGRIVTVVATGGSKRVRATPHAGAANTGHDGTKGRVYCLRAAWNRRFLRQHHGFTGFDDKDDDIVDAAAYTFSELDAAATERPFLGWGRKAS